MVGEETNQFWESRIFSLDRNVLRSLSMGVFGTDVLNVIGGLNPTKSFGIGKFGRTGLVIGR